MLKRAVFFAYGVACYVVFLATFLYAIAFVGNLGTPTALDGPPTGPIARALAIDAGLLALFALQHSIMARKGFKQRWRRIVPKPVERSTYVLFSSVALILLFWQWQPIGGIVWSVESMAATVLLRTMFGVGWALVLIATFLIDHFDLFGLRQVWLYLIGQPYTPRPFATPGPYRLVRHPLYAGWFLAFWMTPTMTVAHLVFAIATSAYILVAIQLEERDLVREFGDSYEDYRRRVPMLVPLPRARQKAVDAAGRRAAV
jgi:protein-S-isoprenylcysteine O-methyltransferase Ste14